ncbi:hypothetical protein KJ570_01665 [Patescibacteria group bacterium]|nr:hypothetical protein [Patescibacteria group bacterium]MBU2036242.1 hypothetical protein [Patescibacteria group bacterium]MBU2214250.1 hypothetical protein [Patescibacteria group bacterium]
MAFPEIDFEERERTVVDRLHQYLVPLELIKEKPTPYELRMKKEIESIWGKSCKYVLTWVGSLNKLAIVPSWHELNMRYPQTPGAHYSHLAFEGISIEPVTNSSNEVVGGNLILFKQRMQRFKRSINSLMLNLPLEIDIFPQAIIDHASILGKDVLETIDPNTQKKIPTRAYVRPAAMRLGNFGICPKAEDGMSLDNIIWSWPFYLPEKVYSEGASAALFLNQQRKQKIVGKHAGNYGSAGVASSIARKTGCDESIIFGPYVIDQEGQKIYVNSDTSEGRKILSERGVLADGPGEDIIFEDRDGNIVISPMDTNILGGTTREYILKIAKNNLMGVKEYPVSVESIRNGEIVGMAFVGNAVKFAPVKEIKLCDRENGKTKIIETFRFENEARNLGILQSVFNDELQGKRDQTGDLLTPIDLENGKKAREKLDQIYAPWF